MHGKPYELEKQRKGEGKVEKQEGEANVRRKREGVAAMWTTDGRRRVEN